MSTYRDLLDEVETLRGELADVRRVRRSGASEKRQRTALVGVRLTPDEFETARLVADEFGLKIPALLRGLLVECLREERP